MAEHDQLFKRIFRVPEHAAGELRSVLPRELVEAIDFDSLERIQSDSVSHRLNERFNDALFSATFRGVRGKIPGFVWLLLEHQSEPEHLMVLRVLEYSVRAWVDLVREDPNIRALPPIVCVVVHHGEQGWTAPTRLHELIPDLAEVPWLRGFVPDFEIIIDDLVRAPDYRLQSGPLTTVARVALWALRDARNIRRFYAHLNAWAADLARLVRESPEDAASILRYILGVAGDEPFERVRQKIIEAVPAAETTMTTIAEQLIQRGEAKGMAKAKAEDLLAVLEARQLLIEEAERTRIVECRNLADLDRWFHRALRANRVSDLFEP